MEKLNLKSEYLYIYLVRKWLQVMACIVVALGFIYMLFQFYLGMEMRWGGQALFVTGILSFLGCCVVAVFKIAIAELLLILVRIEFNGRKPIDKKEEVFQVQKISEKSGKSDFEKWKLDNPGKTINDYYTEKRS